MSDYQPIPCSAHERLDLLRSGGQWLKDVGRRAGRVGKHRAVPLDVYARDGDGVEWLDAQTESGEILRFRLDEIEF
jgi:hypothetical protein